MKRFLMIAVGSLMVLSISAQSLRGRVVDESGSPIEGATVSINRGMTMVKTDANGEYSFRRVSEGTVDVTFEKEGFVEYYGTAKVDGGDDVTLDAVLAATVVDEWRDDVIAALTEAEMEDAEGEDQYVSPVLVSKGDVFTAAANYSFSAVRFRQRGYAYNQPYESNYINGINFNDQERGRFSFSSLGGLNEATRNKESIETLAFGDYSFGNIGSSVNLNMRASRYAAGTKVSLAGANRSYWLRALVSHATGIMNNGWAVIVQGAYRWANEGIMEGTKYNSGAAFISAEKFFDDHHSINIAAFCAPTVRSGSSAVTQETVDLATTSKYGYNQNGIYYNPYWGWQDGKKRNSRVVKSFDPTVLFNYDWKISRDENLKVGWAAHYSMYSNSALTFYNAPDPRPDYYRNLPSYQLMGWGEYEGEYYHDLDYRVSGGSDGFEGGDASLIRTNVGLYNELESAWRAGRKAHGNATTQVNWDGMYAANYANNAVNPNGMAKYMLERRHNDAVETMLNGTYDKKWEHLKLVAGLEAKYTRGIHYKTVDDLMGANQWIDIDPFSDRDITDLAENAMMTQEDVAQVRQNDENNPNRVVKQGDKFGYNYHINVYKAAVFAQNQWDFNKVKFHYGLRLTYQSFNRHGYMQNGRATYLSRLIGEEVISYGKGNRHHFVDPSLKLGVEYAFDGRNKLLLNGFAQTMAPLANNYYISSRIYDRSVAEMELGKYFVDNANKSALMNFYGLSEKVVSGELTYLGNFPFVKVRLTGFYTRTWDGMERSGYYNDEYRTFVNYTMIGVDKAYCGLEAGATFKLHPSWSISTVVGYSYARYTDDAYGVETAENGMKIDGVQELADKVFLTKGRKITGYDEDGEPTYLLDKKGNVFEGLKEDVKVASGPQLVANVKLNYFHPKMWFAELGISYFDYNYLSIAPSRFTQGRLTGVRADGTETTVWYDTEAKREALGTQERLDDVKWYNRFIIDASLGKLIYFDKGRSLNINLSLSNLANNTHIKTGGYQQARIPTVGNDRFGYKVSDNVYKYPSKYYYAWGFNFFLNVTFKF